jgi:hypothetical protein
MYIIVWRSTHKEPFVDVDSHQFLESYYSYESAKDAAEEIIKNEGDNSQWYFDYKIYKESDGY